MSGPMNPTEVGRFRFALTSEDLSTYRAWRSGLALGYGMLVLAFAIATGTLVAASHDASQGADTLHALPAPSAWVDEAPRAQALPTGDFWVTDAFLITRSRSAGCIEPIAQAGDVWPCSGIVGRTSDSSRFAQAETGR